jgi:hypothetical protein
MRLSIVLAAAAALVACGGSDSSSGGEATLASVTPDQLAVTGFSGYGAPAAQVTLRAGGDVAALNGRTLYVAVEAPSTLLDTIAYIAVNEAEVSLEVTLSSSAAPLEPGAYSGDVLLHVCLDADCNQELSGSPKRVAYDVTILAALSLSEESVDVVVPFGTAVPAQRISVGLPVGATSWSLVDMYGSFQVAAAKAGDGTAALDVVFLMDAPGVYQHDYLVNAIAPNPAGGNAVFQKPLSLRYEVTAVENKPCVVAPVDATYAFTIGPWTQGRGAPRLVCQVPGGSSQRSLAYVSAPPEAAGHPLVDEWLYLSDLGEYAVAPCGYVQGAPNWLPAGAYEGLVRYTYTEPGGAVIQLDHAVTMTIAAP